MCIKCGKESLPGLVAGAGLCQFHYNERMFGLAWAEHCRDKGLEKPGNGGTEGAPRRKA